MEYFKNQRVEHFGLIPDMIADRYVDRNVFFFRDEEQSFKEFGERTSKLASGLAQEGVEPGERIGLYLPNSIMFPESLFGAAKAGAVPVPLNLRMPPRTLSYIVEDSDITTIIASKIETNVSDPEQAKNLAEEADLERLIIPSESGGRKIDYDKLINKGNSDYEYPERDFEDHVIQYYTSGTTGRPKGVPLTHKNVLSSITGYSQAVGPDVEDRILHVMPLYHVYGLTAVLGTFLHEGGSIVLQAEAEPDLILENIEKYECNQFPGVPALFRMMWLIYQQAPEKYNIEEHLEEVLCAAAPLDEDTRKNIVDEWKVRFAEGWGMTETSPAGTFRPGSMPKQAGCIGWFLRNMKAKVVDPETHETRIPWKVIAPWGNPDDSHIRLEGELAVKGDPVFNGYYKMPEKNEEVFDDEGWFYTGDIVRMDEDKAFWIVERTDDMILSGGENIYPSAVEEAIMEHSDISDVAVVAAPHKTKGEAPVAFVILKPGAEVTEEEIKEFSLERLPTYAHPRRVFFKEGLPQSGALKTQRYKLENEAKETLSEPLGGNH